MSVLEIITTNALSLIGRAGYLGIALVSFLENVFTPIPSEAVIPFAGILVQQGKLSLTLTIAAATLGSVLGALIFYGIGYWLGTDRTRAFLLRNQRYLRISASDLDRAETWFARYDRWAVLICRVIPLVRSFISIPAGYVKMPLLEFVTLTAVGTAAWSTFLVGLGVLMGHAYTQLIPYFRYLDVAFGLGALVLAFWFLQSRSGRTFLSSD